jgi:hypothetical protein
MNNIVLFFALSRTIIYELLRLVGNDGGIMKNLSSLTVRELFTGWWQVKWVRLLVSMLVPIGIIDAAYTIGMTEIYGVEVEFNPITREFLAAGLWLPWSLINILGFTFFCMMAGSYYLYTRSRPSGPDTFALSFVIALRIAMVAYNVAFYYMPWAGGMVYPPFWSGAFSFVLSLYSMNKLLKRQYDISWAQTKYNLTSRLVNYQDQRLIASAGLKSKVATSEVDSNTEIEKEIVKSSSGAKKSRWGMAWMKRLIYLAGSLFAFVLMGIVLQFISDVTGLSHWSQIHGPFFILNEVTGPPVMISIFVIIGFIGFSLACIFKAFATTDEMDI